MTEYLSACKSFCIACPYDPEHEITNVREIKPHLEACRQAHIQSEAAEGREVDIDTCVFNPAHKIPDPEFTLHSLICEDSSSLCLDSSGQVIKRVDQEKGSDQFASDATSSNHFDKLEAMFDYIASNGKEIAKRFEKEMKDDSSSNSDADELAGFDPLTGLPFQE